VFNSQFDCFQSLLFISLFLFYHDKGTASCKEKSSYCCLDQDGNIGYTTACRNFSGVICHGNETHPTCLGQAACSNTTIGQIQPGNCNGDFACRDALIQEVIDGCNGLQVSLEDFSQVYLSIYL
jgi:hypothetical protein